MTDTDEFAVAVEATLGPVERESFRRLPGGASRETWAFRAGGRDLILRRDPPGRPSKPGGMAREANSMRAAHRAGLRVPEVVADDDGTTFGTAGLVMSRVRGETIPRRILRDDDLANARLVLVSQMGEFLAGLHAIDPSEVPGLERTDSFERSWAAYGRMGDESPTFDAVHRWLAQVRPTRPADSLVHGDFRIGNVIVDADGLSAVIDWELVHLGDPLEDLAWMCVKAWRFGSPLTAGGVGTLDDLIQAYESASQRSVDRESLGWWIVAKTLQWGIICMAQAQTHLTGSVRSIELAAIGRRVAEVEWDLLELVAPVEVAAVWAEPPDEPVDDVGVHPRPTAAELLRATHDFLGGDHTRTTQGQTSFEARVAANVVAMVERQLLYRVPHETRGREGMARLGVGSTGELTGAIRRGDFDRRPQELWGFLASSVRDRLVVTNPRHLSDRPADPDAGPHGGGWRTWGRR